MSAIKKVLLVVNPISGGIDKSGIIELLEEKLKQLDLELVLFQTSGVKDKADLTELIQKVNPERILIAGGDGTIKLIAEIIQSPSIPIGLFPAGSANGLAENFSLPTDLNELSNIALGNNFIEIDSISINNELCLHISDIGLNAALIKNYEEGNIRGKLGYLIQSIPTLIKSDFPFDFTISIGSQVYQRKAVLVGIANAKRYGTGATINPEGRFDDGKFEILVFKSFNIPQILKTFQENAVLSKDFLEIFPATQAVIQCGKKIFFQIDGEYRGEVKEVRAEISPIKIKFAVPAHTKEH